MTSSYPFPRPLSREYSIQGHLLFYSSTPTNRHRLGPVYQTANTVAHIYSTSCSSQMVKHGEGLLQRVTLTISPNGFFIIQITEKNRWVILRDGRLFISGIPPREGTTEGLFRGDITRDGRQVIVDFHRRPWRCWGEAGWNVFGDEPGETEVCVGWVSGSISEVGQVVSALDRAGWPTGDRRLGDGLDVWGVAS